MKIDFFLDSDAGSVGHVDDAASIGDRQVHSTFAIRLNSIAAPTS